MSLATIGAGAGAGFLVAGPPGALVGGLVGGLFGGSKSTLTLPPATPNATPASQGSADLINTIVRNAPQPGIMPPTYAPPSYVGGGTNIDFMTGPATRQMMGYGDYGEMGRFPMWALWTGVGVAAWMLWKTNRESRRA